MLFERIQELCKRNATTPTALCLEITGSSGNLPTWKKGNIRNDYLISIAKHFNVSTDYLLTGKPPVYQPAPRPVQSRPQEVPPAAPYKVPEAKLKKYLTKALKDLFACETISRDLRNYPGITLDVNNIPKIAVDAQIYRPAFTRLQVSESSLAHRTFSDATSLDIWLQHTPYLADVQISPKRLEGFINLYHNVGSLEKNMPDAKRQRLYPTREEFERIALYNENLPEYRALFDMFDKEASGQPDVKPSPKENIG